MSQDTTFSLTDAWGQSHTYEVHRHRGSEGTMLALQLSALLVEPLSAAVGPLLVSSLDSLAAEGKVTTQTVLGKLLDDPEALASIDFAGIGRALQGALGGLPEQTIYRLLAYTMRDGKPLVQAGRASPEFDSAYAGNYLELLRALWEVCGWNGFFPGLGTSRSGAKPGPSPAPATPGRLG